MRIRKMRLEDGIAVTRLHRNTVRKVNSKDYTPAQIERWTSWISVANLRKDFHARQRFVAVTTENRVVGVLNMSLDGATVTRLFVNASLRGHGIGSLLLQKAEEIARANGRSTVQLKSTKTARTFYEKHGYKRVESTPIVGGQARLPLYRMKKRLR